MMKFDSYLKKSDDLNRKIQKLFIPTGVTTKMSSPKVQIKRTAKAKRIFVGTVLSVENNLFSAEIKGTNGVYHVRIQKKY